MKNNKKKGLHQEWNTFSPNSVEDQKKKLVFTNNGTLFSPNSVKEQNKKRFSPQMEHFFPHIEVDTYAQMHTIVKLFGGMQM